MAKERTRRYARAHAQLRWAFVLVRSTSPLLFIGYLINAAVLVVLPAAIALSVRELVNGVSQALAGVPLEQTTAHEWLLIGFAATLGASLCGALARYFPRRFETELRVRLHLDIARHHASMPFPRIEDPHYLNGLRRVQANPELHVSNLCAHSLDLATKALQSLTLMAILFAIEPLLFAMLLPVAIPYLLFQWRLARRQFEEVTRRAETERWTGYYLSLLSDLDQAGEIKLLNLAPVFLERTRVLMHELRGMYLGYLGFEFQGSLLFAVFSVAAVYLALWHSLGAILAGKLTIGDLAIFGSAAGQLRALVEQSIGLVASTRWERLHVEKLLEFFALDPGGQPATGRPLGELQGRIELKNVSFRYPGAATDTLKNLSFAVEPGETVALVGANGAGKSTVAKLIAGFYPIQQGQILFDDRDSRELDPVQLQRQIACVFQTFGRYEATAADTLAFGDWTRLQDDPDAIEAIARRARVHDLILSMPEGYETLLGRRFGRYQPSGGQWQQLCIARLIGRDARILILDEPTANLDVSAEAELFEHFRALAAGRTTLLISHRFSTVSMADRILVMDDGCIVESGSHGELMAQNGRYAALFALAWRFPEAPPSPAAAFTETPALDSLDPGVEPHADERSS